MRGWLAWINRSDDVRRQVPAYDEAMGWQVAQGGSGGGVCEQMPGGMPLRCSRLGLANIG
jgi:hypothetical protein